MSNTNNKPAASPNDIPQVLVTPLKPALIHGVAQKLPVLVRLQAPDAPTTPATERRSYHLALVIDRSGSMSGEPLSEAVRCARHMVDRLEPSDVASLVVFDHHVNVLAPARPVGNRKALHAALAMIRSGGTTNLYGGWKAGAEALLPGAGDAALARVILLSDGNANAGDATDTHTIAGFCAEAAARGVSTSTYGLGKDFNEELMVEMARKGNGNPYYGDTAADLFEPFAAEFDLITSLYAQKVRLSLSVPEGVTLRVRNDYPIEEHEGFPCIRLPDLPYGAEAWVLLELAIPALLTMEAGNILLQAGVTATTTEGLPLAFPEAALRLKSMLAPAWEMLLPDPLVVARQAEIEAGELLAAARKAAEDGDWQAIQRMIEEARKRSAGHPWVIDVLEHIATLAKTMDTERFRKEAMYSSQRFASRLASKDEELGSVVAESAAPSFLRRKTAQGKAQFDTRGDKGRK